MCEELLFVLNLISPSFLCFFLVLLLEKTMNHQFLSILLMPLNHLSSRFEIPDIHIQLKWKLFHMLHDPFCPSLKLLQL